MFNFLINLLNILMIFKQVLFDDFDSMLLSSFKICEKERAKFNKDLPWLEATLKNTMYYENQLSHFRKFKIKSSAVGLSAKSRAPNVECGVWSVEILTEQMEQAVNEQKEVIMLGDANVSAQNWSIPNSKKEKVAEEIKEAKSIGVAKKAIKEFCKNIPI